LEGIEQGKYKTETVQTPKSAAGARNKNNNAHKNPANRRKSPADKSSPNKTGEQNRSGNKPLANKAKNGQHNQRPAQASNKPARPKPAAKTLVIQKPKPKLIVE